MVQNGKRYGQAGKNKKNNKKFGRIHPNSTKWKKILASKEEEREEVTWKNSSHWYKMEKRYRQAGKKKEKKKRLGREK